jgi:hypothetical protein
MEHALLSFRQNRLARFSGKVGIQIAHAIGEVVAGEFERQATPVKINQPRRVADSLRLRQGCGFCPWPRQAKHNRAGHDSQDQSYDQL